MTPAAVQWRLASWILTGIREGWRERRGSPLRNTVGLAAALWLVLLALAVRLLSRHRELSADRGTARLTGSPAQLDRMERALDRRSAS